MSTPLVSVIATAYRHRKFLEECVRSVLGQTFTDFELLISEDCSEDGSAEWIDEHACKDARVRRLPAPINLGQAARMLELTHEARGKYICALNGDDAFEPNLLASQVRFLEENPSVTGAFVLPRYVDEGGNLLDQKFEGALPTSSTRLDQLAAMVRYDFGSCFLHVGSMLRMEVAKAFPYRAWCLHNFDGDLWIRLLVSGHELKQRDASLVRYRLLGDRNMGADTLANSRVWWSEKRLYLRNYLALGVADCKALFPELDSRGIEDEAIRRVAILRWFAENLRAPYLRSMAVSMLYDHLEVPAVAARVAEMQDFTVHHGLAPLARANDPYNLALERVWTGRSAVAEDSVPKASARALYAHLKKLLKQRYLGASH